MLNATSAGYPIQRYRKVQAIIKTDLRPAPLRAHIKGPWHNCSICSVKSLLGYDSTTCLVALRHSLSRVETSWLTAFGFECGSEQAAEIFM